MGELVYPVTFIGPAGEISVDALIDTGATFNYLPRPLLERLGVQATSQKRFAVADGRIVNYDIGSVMTRINDEEQPTPCIFGEPDTEPLVGVVTLETFLLGVDPVNQTLIPVTGRLKGLSLSAGADSSQGFERRVRR
ncbi:MAG: aspartyl protease family protein [Proteobacteria bacterium]|nr:aspartyl protease family protein [Pseudomonadota bacterium]